MEFNWILRWIPVIEHSIWNYGPIQKSRLRAQIMFMRLFFSLIDLDVNAYQNTTCALSQHLVKRHFCTKMVQLDKKDTPGY